MMLDHGGFSCVQFPAEWGTPRFQLGELVSVDGEVGTIVGVHYESSISYNPEFDTHELGWWFMVSVPSQVGEKILKHVSGWHQDVIQPVLTVGSSEIQQEGVCIPPISTLEPLCFGVF